MGAPQRRPAARCTTARPTCPASFDAVIARAHGQGPRRPLPVGRRPRPRGAGRRRRAAWRRRPERMVAVGEAAPGDRQETVVSPDQAPTVLAAERARARAGWLAAGRWPRCRSPGLALDRAPSPSAAAATAAATAPATTTSGVDRHRHDHAAAERGDQERRSSAGGPNNIVLANGKAWVVRSGNARLAVIDAKTAKREPYSPRVGRPDAARPPASASCGSINQAAPSLVPIGLKSHRQEGSAGPAARARAGRSRSPPAATRCGSASAATRACCCASTPRTARSRPRPSSCPTACRTSPSAAARCGSSRGARTPSRAWTSPAARSARSSSARSRSGSPTARGAVWVTNNGDDTVTRIDSGSLNTRDHPGRARARRAIAVGAGAVWVANSIASTVTRIDPQTSQPVGRADRRRAQPLRRRHPRQRRLGHEPQRRQGPAADAWLARGRASRRRRPAAPRPPAASASGSGAGARSRSAGRACAGAT